MSTSTTTNYGWTIPNDDELVKNGAAAIRTLGQAIDTTAAASFGGGLVLLNTTTMSGVSSQSVENFTSATYLQYKIVASIEASTAGNIQFRFRENTTDKTTDYYGGGWRVSANSSSGLVAIVNAGAQATIGRSNSNGSSHDLLFTKKSGTTAHINGTSFSRWSEGDGPGLHAYSNTSMTDVTGFTIYPFSGTMSGQIKVFGVKE